jgi:RimJ/RimL family protein N-acetyltransferase
MDDEDPGSVWGTVELRAVVDADLPIFFEHQRDPVSVTMAAFPSREREAFMAHWAKIRGDDSVIIRTILLDGRVAGNVVSFHRFGKREVGYWIGREDWGKGVASRALNEFLNLERTRPLFARVAKHNRGSLRVLQKCGFVFSADPDEETVPVDDGIEDFLLELGDGGTGAAG